MAATTPRRSSRIPHAHTPKMSERKKGLFQGEMEPTRESLTTHRRLPVVDSESDSEECDLGIISTLDSSSDENEFGTPKKPNRSLWRKFHSSISSLSCLISGSQYVFMWHPILESVNLKIGYHKFDKLALIPRPLTGDCELSK